MGEDVHKDQIKYLADTPQPTNLTTAELCDRVAVMMTSQNITTPALVEVLKDKHLRPWGRISYS
jgi:hypothetical protein